MKFFDDGMGTTPPTKVDEYRDKMIAIKELLKNPDIELDKDAEITLSCGEHHGKEWIRSMGDKIKRYLIMKPYVKQVGHSHYNPQKGGRIEVKNRDEIKNQYYICIVDKKTNAYAFEIEFYAKDKWKVIILTKILKNKIKDLDDYSIVIK
jgi:hypothetical protein